MPVINDPVFVIYRAEGKVAITTNPAPHDTPETIGIMLCYAVRQMAANFNNDEAASFAAMEYERQHPSDEITLPDGEAKH